MIAKEARISSFKTVLEPYEGSKLPPGLNTAIAIQTKAGAAQDLKIFIPLEDALYPAFEAVAEEMEQSELGTQPWRIQLVDSADDAKLGIVARGRDVGFQVLDSRARSLGFTEIPHVVPSDKDHLQRVMRSAAHYYYYLEVNNPNPYICENISIEFFELGMVNNGQTSGPIGKNLYDKLKARLELPFDPDAEYGMKIVNRTNLDLHFAIFFFDHSDLSIGGSRFVSRYGPFTEPIPGHLAGENDIEGPYTKDYSLRKGATAEIGYGTLGIPSISPTMDDSLSLTIGFLKLYFTTEHVNFYHIIQDSPFEKSGTRGFKQKKKVEEPQWGTVLIPVVQSRRPRVHN